MSAFVDAQSGGFSINLVHRDFEGSPFYNPKETPARRVGIAGRRSIGRVHRFSHMLHLNSSRSISDPSDPDAQLTANNGEYLVNISLGTPPFPIVAIADTGSDIIWTQCKPCTDCYKQDAPLFDTKSSSSYRTVSCSSNACNSLQSEGSSCSSDGSVCEYQVSYGDQSHTQGDVAAETLTLESKTGNPVALPKTVIGCGHDNAGTFSPKGSGIVGLGGGPASLVSQLGSSIGGKFSYCMVPYAAAKPTSTMNFGTNAVVSGNVQGSSIGGSGNIIIDSGTTLTLVPTDFFSQLSDAVETQVTGGTKTSDPEGFFSLCYVPDSSLKLPPVTAHFKGADVVLTSDNIFIQVNDKVVCLAFYANDQLSIYGNVAQQIFLIGYDLPKQTLSFKPTDCTNT
ncbi:unnamed protein product [Linum tenue]|uniref:Peptidase A1 domain-containing protein n=1 Tax=Linum tenue TaxID=586396 RepID=A0AAV0LIQ4_9ROSI|nr:unnamed protein product [Linum tenue]